MNRHLLFTALFCIITMVCFSQRKSNQISLRIGEPMSVGYKRAINDRHALELLVGTAKGNWSASYYRNAFDHYLDEDIFEYVSHDVENIFYLQTRFLFQKPIPWDEVPGTFEWYWGFGALYKQADLTYKFGAEGFDDFKTTFRDIDAGPEAIVGFDYTFRDVPLSLYSELDVLCEVTDRVAAFRGFMVIGLRLNF